MYLRSASARVGTGAALLALLLTSCPKPQPTPATRARTVTPPPRKVKRATPQPKPPLGPDLKGKILASLTIGAMHKLDKRIARLMPSIVPPAKAAHLFTGEFLPSLLEEIKLDRYALRAVDMKRQAMFAVVQLAPIDVTARRPEKAVALIGAIPVKSGKLMLETFRSSYPASKSAAWGGLRVKVRYGPRFWADVRGEWLVVAPTPQLLDSAHKLLPPLARRVGEGRAVIRIAFSKVWKPLSLVIGRLKRMGMSHLLRELFSRDSDRKLATRIVNRMLAHVASIGDIKLSLQVGDAGWTARVRLNALVQGALARLAAAARPSGGFGLNLLPEGAILAGTDGWTSSGKSLVVDLQRLMMAVLIKDFARRLPRQVEARGLLDRPRAAPYALFARTLRDLNLPAGRLRKIFERYQLAMGAHAIWANYQKAAKTLNAASGDQSAIALYPRPGPGVAFAIIMKLKNPRLFQTTLDRFMTSSVPLVRRFLNQLWTRMAPRDVRLAIRRIPLQVSYRRGAARIGGARVNASTLRVLWPKRLPKSLRSMTRDLAQARKVFETVFGKDLTFGWAVVGDKVVGAGGKDWRSLLGKIIKRASAKVSAKGSLLGDPAFKRAYLRYRNIRGFGKRGLTLGVFSLARLLGAALDGVKTWAPHMLQNPFAGMIAAQLQRMARNPRGAISLQAIRDRDALTYKLHLPVSDLKVMTTSAMVLYMGVSPTRSRPPMPHHP